MVRKLDNFCILDFLSVAPFICPQLCLHLEEARMHSLELQFAAHWFQNISFTWMQLKQSGLMFMFVNILYQVIKLFNFCCLWPLMRLGNYRLPSVAPSDTACLAYSGPSHAMWHHWHSHHSPTGAFNIMWIIRFMFYSLFLNNTTQSLEKYLFNLWMVIPQSQGHA